MLLRGKRVTNERLQSIKNLGRLRQLELHKTSIDDEGVSFLSQAVGLQEIVIQSDILSDRSMKVFCRLPELRSLLIQDAPLITDLGVAQLESRTELRELYLRGTHLSDRGVRSFSHLQGLSSVGLNRTLVTDKGLAGMASMQSLGLLNLSDTAVVGDGLCALPPLDDLDIYLENCPVTDAAVLAFCRHLQTLKTLSLKNSQITDRCLPALASLPQLNMLRLSETSVTDAGVLSLLEHPMLQSLEVCDTSVTEAAKQQLEAASPQNLMVIR